MSNRGIVAGPYLLGIIARTRYSDAYSRDGFASRPSSLQKKS